MKMEWLHMKRFELRIAAKWAMYHMDAVTDPHLETAFVGPG
jgi:hypothetical protein